MIFEKTFFQSNNEYLQTSYYFEIKLITTKRYIGKQNKKKDISNLLCLFLFLFALITKSASFAPSAIRVRTLQAPEAVKTASSDSATTSSRLKRTKGFVDWAKESGIKYVVIIICNATTCFLVFYYHHIDYLQNENN